MSTTKKSTLTAVLITFFSLLTMAQEAINPTLLCDRFLNSKDKTKCLNTVTRVNPDSYLAAVCDHFDSDDKMYNCINTKGAFALDQLRDCHNEELSEDQRLACISAAQVNPKNQYQETELRKPASSERRYFRKESTR